jgi:hypothetical protein
MGRGAQGNSAAHSPHWRTLRKSRDKTILDQFLGPHGKDIELGTADHDHKANMIDGALVA